MTTSGDIALVLWNICDGTPNEFILPHLVEAGRQGLAWYELGDYGITAVGITPAGEAWLDTFYDDVLTDDEPMRGVA